MAATSPCTSASTVPSSRLRTQPPIPSRAASWRSDSRNQTPCTRPWIRSRRVIRSLIAADLPARHLPPRGLLLFGEPPLLRCPCRPRRHALLRHHVQALEARGQAPESDLAVARLRRRVLRDHDHSRRRVDEAQRRLRLVHVLAAWPARAKRLHDHLALERLAIGRVRRRTFGNADGHEAI